MLNDNMDNEVKLGMLQVVYAVYGEWAQGIPFVCKKGCSHCCTQSVTMTTLEGELISQYDQEGILLDDFLKNNDNTVNYGRISTLTTNQFARRCLAGEEIEFAEESWQFLPCPFLHDKSCRIYPVRPFGCRSFGSLLYCLETGSAEVPPLAVTINTVLMQIIEHIDQGRPWGNMLNIMGRLHMERVESWNENNGWVTGLVNGSVVSEPIPRFLIPPEEQEDVDKVLADLYDREVSGKSFRVWLKQCAQRITK